jgi:type I restriction enzyme S subunit
MIGDLYYRLSYKIENLRRQNETLEAIAQTLFKHWFVDFEFPNADGKPYKSSGGEMERSELGEIPADWRIGGVIKLWIRT